MHLLGQFLETPSTITIEININMNRSNSNGRWSPHHNHNNNDSGAQYRWDHFQSDFMNDPIQLYLLSTLKQPQSTNVLYKTNKRHNNYKAHMKWNT